MTPRPAWSSPAAVLLCLVTGLAAQKLDKASPVELLEALGKGRNSPFLRAVSEVLRRRSLEFLPALDAAMLRLLDEPKRGRERPLLALLDAQIQLRGRPPAALLQRIVSGQRLSDPILGALVVLMARHPKRYRVPLLALHRATGRGLHSLGLTWTACGESLARIAAPEFAAECLRGVYVRAFLTLRMPGSESPESAAMGGGAFGATSPNYYHFPKHNPRFGIYRLLSKSEARRARKQARSMGLSIHQLFPGRGDLFYQRQFSKTARYPLRKSFARPQVVYERMDWLAKMLGVGRKELGVELFPTSALTWVDAAGYRRRIAAIRKTSTDEVRALAARLQARGLIDADLAARVRPAVSVRIIDERGKGAPALPKLDGVHLK